MYVYGSVSMHVCVFPCRHVCVYHYVFMCACTYVFICSHIFIVVLHVCLCIPLFPQSSLVTNLTAASLPHYLIHATIPAVEYTPSH